MINQLLDTIGAFTKLIYLLPFVNFYIIARRKSDYFKDGLAARFLAGVLIAGFGIVAYVVPNILNLVGFLNDSNFFLKDAYIVQLCINISLLIGYVILLLNSIKMLNQRLTFNELLLFLVFVLLIVYITSLIINDLLLGFVLFTYAVEIFFLASSFIVSSFIIKGFSNKYYYLPIISAFLLIIDLLLFNQLFVNCLVDWSSATCFYELRSLMHLVGGIAILLLFIPNIKLFFQLSNKRKIIIKKSNSLVEATIRLLLIEFQKIYGDVIFNIYKNACLKFNNDFNKNLSCDEINLSGLTVRDSKVFLKVLISVFKDVLSEDLTLSVVKRIMNYKNKELLINCLNSD